MGTSPHDDLLGEGSVLAITLASADAPIPLRVPFVHELVGFTVFRSRTATDGRDSFHLHVGYFANEARAQEALGVVRRFYPAARIAPAPGSGLGSLDDTLNTAFQMVRSANARVVGQGGVPPPPAIDSQFYAVRLETWMRHQDPQPIPRLPVFRAFNVYSVRTDREGAQYQEVRLGFFRNLHQAKRVAEYVRSHYPRAGIVPVSHRERARVLELTSNPAQQANKTDQPRRSGPDERHPLDPVLGRRATAAVAGNTGAGSTGDTGRTEDPVRDLLSIRWFLRMVAPRERKITNANR